MSQAAVRSGEATMDLVNSYERALDYIPALSEKLEMMQEQTVIKAEVLEERMRALLQGYEHLDNVSSKVSTGFRQAAEDYKEKVLQAAIGGGVHTLGMNTDNMERLKAELDSIAHERVVVDVLTRDMLRDSKIGDGAKRAKVASARKIKELYEPIVVPEYTSSGVSHANNLVGRNMEDLLFNRNARSSKGPESLVARNTALGQVVPSARAGIPEEILSLQTTPSAKPPRRKSSRRNIGNDAVYGLLSEELSHRNATLKRELNNVKAKIDELGNKRPVRSRNWSKEQLKGVMEAVISKYVQATNHQLYPQYDAEELEEQIEQDEMVASPSVVPVSRSKPRHVKSVAVETEIDYEEPLPESALEGYRVIEARGSFQSAPVSALPTPLQPEEPEPETAMDSEVDDALPNEDVLAGAKLMGVDRDYIILGGKGGVRWVAAQEGAQYGTMDTNEKYGIGDDESGAAYTPKYITIHGQKLVYEEDTRDDRPLHLVKHKPSASGRMIDGSVPQGAVDGGRPDLADDFDYSIPRVPWPLLSRVKPLRKVQSDDAEELDDLAAPTKETALVGIASAQEVVPESNLPVAVAPPQNPDDPQSTAIVPLVDLLRAVVDSHQSTINSNYEMLAKLMEKMSETQQPSRPKDNSMDFYSPLSRIACDIFLMVYNASEINRSGREVGLHLLVEAIRHNDEFAVALATDERYGDEDTVDSVLGSFVQTRGDRSYVSVNDLLSFLDNRAAQPQPPGQSGIAQAPHEASAVEVADALAKALGAMVASAAPAREPQQNLIDSAFVRDAVKEGIEAAMLVVGAVRQGAPDSDQVDMEESFVTYQSAGDDDSFLDDSELIEEGRNFEGTHRGLLHAGSMGAGTRRGDSVFTDNVESRRNVQLLRDVEDSDAEASIEWKTSSRRRSSSAEALAALKRVNARRGLNQVGNETSDDSFVSASSTTSSAMPVKRSKKLPAQWDHDGRRVKKPISSALMSKKAGCTYTLAAQELSLDDSGLLGSRSVSNTSILSTAKSAARYASYDDDNVSEVVKSSGWASFDGEQSNSENDPNEETAEEESPIEEDVNELLSMASSDDDLSLRITGVLQLSKKIRRAPR